MIHQFQSAVLVNGVVVLLDWIALGLVLFIITLNDILQSFPINLVVVAISGIHATAMVFVFDSLKGLALAGKKDSSAIKMKKTSRTPKNSKTIKKSGKSSAGKTRVAEVSSVT